MSKQLTVGYKLMSKVNRAPLRVGNEYIVVDVDIPMNSFTIEYFDGTLPYRRRLYSLSLLDDLFNIVYIK